MDWQEIRNIAAWIAGCAMVVLVAWAPVSCVKDRNAKIESMVQAGMDPLSARCAIVGEGEREFTCAILAAKKSSK